MSKKRDKPSPRRAAPAPDAVDAVTLARHPRAQHQIHRAKAWAAVLGFGVAAYSSWHAGAVFVDAVLRGLLWGAVAYVVVWLAAQQVWRHLAVAEVRAHEKLRAERRAQALAALQDGEGDRTMVLRQDGGG